MNFLAAHLGKIDSVMRTSFYVLELILMATLAGFRTNVF